MKILGSQRWEKLGGGKDFFFFDLVGVSSLPNNKNALPFLYFSYYSCFYCNFYEYLYWVDNNDK